MQNEGEFSFKDFFIPFTITKAILWITIIGFIVYFNALFNGFVWDDVSYILINPVEHTMNLIGLFGPNYFNSAGYYRPVPALYFSLLYNLFHTTSFFYHFSQLAIHIVDTSLLFILFTRFFKKPVAFILSLIFLVHPMNIESVSYISASEDIFFFFGISALLLSFKSAIQLSRLLLIFLLLFFALLTKETGIIFLFLVLFIRFLYVEKNRFPFLIASIFTLGLYMIMRVATIGINYPKEYFIPIMNLSFLQRLLNIPAIMYYYTHTFLFPKDLAISQNWVVTKLNIQNFYLPLGADLVVLFTLLFLCFYIYLHKHNSFKDFIFFLLWYVMGLGIISQIVPLEMTVSDRWFYFPMAGGLGLIGIAISVMPKNTPVTGKIFLFFAILILTLLSARTIVRNTNWVDGITLYSHDAKIQDDYNKEDMLGKELINNGAFTEAVLHIKKSVDSNPYYANVNDLGVAYQHLGNIQKAEEFYTQATLMKTYTLSPNINLAEVQALYGNPNSAIKSIREKLLPVYPNTSHILLLLAVAEYRVGNQQTALQAVQKAYSLSMDRQTTYLLNFIQDKQSIRDLDNNLLE